MRSLARELFWAFTIYVMQATCPHASFPKIYELLLHCTGPLWNGIHFSKVQIGFLNLKKEKIGLGPQSTDFQKIPVSEYTQMIPVSEYSQMIPISEPFVLLASFLINLSG